MNNFEIHEAFVFLQKRKLFRVRYNNEQISKLYEELGFEEIYRLGIFRSAKSLLQKIYEISNEGKLLSSDTSLMKVFKND